LRSTNKRLRVGIVGFGAVAKEHVAGWTASGNLVCAIADAALPSSPLPDAQLFPDLESLLAKAEVDTLDICTPHHRHWSDIQGLMDWPGTVLVEKPLVISVGDLDQIVPVLESRLGRILVRTNKRFEPHIKALLSELQRAGPECPIDLSIEWYQKPKYMADRPWYHDRTISGGGVVLGMGIHYFEILVSLFPSMKVDEAVLETHTAPPNSPETTVENDARLKLSCSRAIVDLRLACWREKKNLPIETINAKIGKSTFRFKRPRHFDRHLCLSEEFGYYSRMVLDGRPIPRPADLYQSHLLALSAYQVAEPAAQQIPTPK
jgi:predicted dehydrogenase